MKCKICGGQCFELGTLGWVKYVRCQACGMQFSRKVRVKKVKERAKQCQGFYYSET